MEDTITEQIFTFFVSPAGSDQWSGTCPDPAEHGAGPFATIARAQLEARKTLSGNRYAAVSVLIRRGRYFLDQPIVFTSEDSGTARSPVVYGAYPGEASAFSGGRRIANWAEGTVNGRKCWVADLKLAGLADLNFTQLFVNGKRRQRPRLPKKGFFHFAGIPEEASSFQGFCKGPDRALYSDDNIKRWKNLTDIGVVVLQLWFDTHYKISEIDTEKKEVRFSGPSIGSLKDEKGEMARYCLENVFEALDAPGEWYLDKPKARLYYIPFPDENMEGADVIVPVLDTLVRFQGSKEHPVSHIRLENISFRHAEWRPPANFVGAVQAAYDVPGALVLEYAAHCVLYACEISQISQYGVQVATGSTQNRIVACSIHDLGAGGVRIDHEWLERINETSTKNMPRKNAGAPSETTVSDCSIHDGSLIYLSAIGIWIGNAGFNRILRNHIFNLNYTGISSGWTWGYADTATVDNRIEDNHIHHINWNRLLSDNGGIYTLGMTPGCVLRGNHIHHVDCYGYGGWGIYHDEGTTGQLVENNVVHHTRNAGFFTHYGRDNIIRNNIFALSRTSHIGPGSKKENHRTTLFENNILFWREGSPGSGHNAMTNWDTRYYMIRNNLFWSCGSTMNFGEGTTLQTWQEKGQFKGTLVADPLFADPDAGDFTLRHDSPASSIHFKPFKLSAGPRTFSGKRAASFDNWPEEKEKAHPISLSSLAFKDAGTARFTITNPGRIPIAGKMRFKAGPKGAAGIAPKTAIAFEDLSPGESRTMDIPLEVNPEAKWFFLEGIPSGKGILPAFLHRTIGDIVILPELGAISDPKDVADAMSSIPWRPVTNSMGNEVARTKCALSGNSLLVQVKTVDLNVRPVESRPYEGSCVELFITPSRPDAENRLCQLFLIPSEDRRNLSISRLHSGQAIPEQLAVGLCTPWEEKGYELSAIVPLETARIPTDFAQFFFEIGFNGDFGGNGGRGKMLAFGSPAPFSSTEGCARLRRG